MVRLRPLATDERIERSERRECIVCGIPVGGSSYWCEHHIESLLDDIPETLEARNA
jgi:hypothetical protein